MRPGQHPCTERLIVPSPVCDIVSRLRQLQHRLMSGTYLWSLSDALMSDALSSKTIVKGRKSFKSRTSSYVMPVLQKNPYKETLFIMVIFSFTIVFICCSFCAH